MTHDLAWFVSPDVETSLEWIAFAGSPDEWVERDGRTFRLRRRRGDVYPVYAEVPLLTQVCAAARRRLASLMGRG